MKGKKSILFLLVLLLCLVAVGCGKEEKEADESSKKKEVTVNTLKCDLSDEDGNKGLILVEQDKKTFKFTKAVMETTMKKESYSELTTDKDLLKTLLCSDESYKSCDVTFDDDEALTVKMELDIEEYEKEAAEDDEELDENSLNKLKEQFEEELHGSVSCTITK